MTEFDFIKHYLKQHQSDSQLIMGVGDDAAIIRPQIGFDLHISADMLLVNRHFFVDVAPRDLAYKILAVNLSDMAAMGAAPRWAILSAALPQLEEKWLTPFCDSLFSLAHHYGVKIIGGDTTKGDWAFNVTIIGETPSQLALKRSGAQIGDDIWVTGHIGLAAAALDAKRHKIQLPALLFSICEEKRLRPTPRVALGKQLLTLANAAIDISDGFIQDLNHILEASDVGAIVELDKIPLLPEIKKAIDEKQLTQGQVNHWMLAGGDDYELIFTAQEKNRLAIIKAAQKSEVPVSFIGKIKPDLGLKMVDKNHHELHLTYKGFDHFG